MREIGGFGAEVAEARKFTAQELKTEEEFIQYFLFLLKDDPGLAANSETALSLAQTLAKQQIEFQTNHINQPASFAAYDGDKIVGIGQLIVQNNKRGFLVGLNVDPQFRGQGVSKSLTDARIDCAKKIGCDYVDTNVASDNPLGLVTKFRDGFILTGYNIAEVCFILSKKINAEEDFDKHNGPLGELKEVSLADIASIENYTRQGWAGIDIKNIGNTKDDSPENWLLILEKVKK